MLTACSDSVPDTPEQTVSENTVKNASEQKITRTTVQAIPEYKIVEDEVKRTVEVERTFIMYRLANGSDGSVWATTHYNPDLKVDIVGASASDYERIKNTNISKGEILGSWMVSRRMDSKVTAYKKGG